jgi:hypothetical protein
LIVALFLIIALISAAYWHFRLKPKVLTRRHSAEIAQTLEHNYQTIYNYEVNQDPQILRDVATGIYLEGLLNPHRFLCPDCPYRYVAINVRATNLRVLRYSDSFAEVEARIEIAEVSIDRSTNYIRVPCYGTAEEGNFFLRKEDGVWKVAGGRYGELDTATPVEIIRQSVCPENWEDVLYEFLENNR